MTPPWINRFISRLGEKFHFDAHYFIKNTIWLLIGQFLMSIAAFGVTYVLANYVSKQQVGDYRLIISLYATLLFFSLSGVCVALVKSIANNKHGALRTSIAIKRKYSVLTMLIGLCVAAYFYFLKDNAPIGISILIMSICLPIIETYTLYSSYLQGRHEFKYSSLNNGLIKVISAAVVVGIAFFYPKTAYLVAGLYVSQAIVTYIQYKFLIKKFPPQNTEEDDTLVPYSKHLTYAGIAVLLFGQADKFVLYHFFGPVALASYWIASTIPQELGRVLSTLSTVVYPKFVKGGLATKQMLFKNGPKITMIMLIASGAYAAVAYPIFHIFLPEYMTEVTKSIVLMFAFTVMPYSFIWQYFYSQGNVKAVYVTNIIDPVLQILLIISLVPWFGIWGLVYAMLAKTFLLNIIGWILLKKY